MAPLTIFQQNKLTQNSKRTNHGDCKQCLAHDFFCFFFIFSSPIHTKSHRIPLRNGKRTEKKNMNYSIENFKNSHHAIHHHWALWMVFELLNAVKIMVFLRVCLNNFSFLRFFFYCRVIKKNDKFFLEKSPTRAEEV